MIGLASQTVDANGALVIYEDFASTIQELTARVDRSKCLDGTAHIQHSGYSDGDRVVSVQARLKKTDESTLRTLFTGKTEIGVSLKDGYYTAALETLQTKSGSIHLRVLLKEKVST